MVKNLVIKHSIFKGLVFTFKNFEDETPATLVFAELEKFFESNNVSKKDRFTLPTLRRALKDMNPIKGHWYISVSNPATEAPQEAMRKALQRDEERKAKKLHKKAKKFAERSLRNGNRNFLNSQSKKSSEDTPTPPKLKPSKIALMVHNHIK